MDGLIEFFDKIAERYPSLTLTMTYTKYTDWDINISYQDDIICHLQGCDPDYVSAKAKVLFKEWLMDNKGGY